MVALREANWVQLSLPIMKGHLRTKIGNSPKAKSEISIKSVLNRKIKNISE